MLLVTISTFDGELLAEFDAPYDPAKSIHLKALAAEFIEAYQHAYALAHLPPTPKKRRPTLTDQITAR